MTILSSYSSGNMRTADTGAPRNLEFQIDLFNQSQQSQPTPGRGYVRYDCAVSLPIAASVARARVATEPEIWDELSSSHHRTMEMNGGAGADDEGRPPSKPLHDGLETAERKVRSKESGIRLSSTWNSAATVDGDTANGNKEQKEALAA